VNKAVLSLTLGLMVAAWGAEVPRPAPEFQASVPNRSPIQLSKYKGKVVVLEFLHTTCVHCQHATQVMNQFVAQYGPKGFQPIGVAFNEGAAGLVAPFVRDFKVRYPVGYADRKAVLAFLQHDPSTLLSVPQVVIIDRKGVIRHQSLPRNDADSAREGFLRDMIERLLNESGGAARPKSRAVKRPAV
jgi:peroxiredoxin